jgi:hypothetical protein
MKHVKRLSLLLVLVFAGALLSAQTADDVIAKYVDAIGGKKTISKIKSMYVEMNMDLMGMEGTSKTTTLNGKGVKQELDIMGSTVVNCITDEGGWTINPMMGGTSPIDMTEDQYNAARDQIHVGGPFVDYAEKGYKVELTGDATVGNAPAHKIKMTSPDNVVTEYYFDKDSGYLVRVKQQGDMGETTSTFSDYRKNDGYATAYKIDIDAGGQYQISANITKVELNKPVDESIFNKPE